MKLVERTLAVITVLITELDVTEICNVSRAPCI